MLIVKTTKEEKKIKKTKYHEVEIRASDICLCYKLISIYQT